MGEKLKVGDRVLVQRFAPVFLPNFYEAEIIEVLQPKWETIPSDMVLVKPLQGIFKRPRWIGTHWIHGIIQTAESIRQRAKLEELEKMFR